MQTSDFKVVRRGVRFMNAYPKYNEDIKYFDSIGESMLHSQNYLSLQSTKGLTFEEFCTFFRKHDLLNFVLCSSSDYTIPTKSKNKEVDVEILACRSSLSFISFKNEKGE